LTFEKTYIPYGAYWTTPFCRWQGSLAGTHSMKLAAQVGRTFLADRKLGPDAIDGLIFGISVPQASCFYGAPWLAGMMGLEAATGPTVAQACATSARMLVTGATEIEAGTAEGLLAVACDRTSNGPHVYYPDPGGPGGTGAAENPVMDSFNLDPWAKNAMIQTAENVAAKTGITRQEQEAVTLLRHEQYAEALADDRAFQRKYMIPVELRRGKKVVGTVDGDEGVHPADAEGLGRLRPVLDGGTVTFGTQTHPADANAGLLLCSRERAQALAKDSGVTVRLRSFGQARVEKGLMPMAVVPAAKQALDRCGLGWKDCAAIKTHNPFAVNDVYFCRETGLPAENVNRYGSPLVYGHPQAPMGLRVVIELIEELVQRGGGHGLFTGCAAGDTAMALVVEVS
jgi:acetyl-CoA acetyltransferase family protein